MMTLICPTCGCSLVRLGISEKDSVAHQHGGKEYRFCCQACVDVFTTSPEERLEETKDLIVCPTCLAEKPRNWAVEMKIGDQEVYFCRCPYCPEVFRKNPDFYGERLEGRIPNEGVVLDSEACCVRPVG